MKKELNTAAKFLIPGYGLSSLIAETAIESFNKSKKIIEEGSPEAIELEIKRKKAETEILEMEAKVNQELSIAKRIENAIDVEIEEYYEAGAGGKIGVNVSKDGFGGELGGNQKKVVKRIYKFKGKSNN